jgi:phosphatidylserine decarboxylase
VRGLRRALARAVDHAGFNFVLTNRIPRRLATRAAAWFSRIEQPLIACASIAVWRLFCDVDLRDARKPRFASLHDCFVRELAEGARPIDPTPGILVSPCDGIVVASGPLRATSCVQAKGFTYTLEDLLIDPALCEEHRDGAYATLRLTAGMYHRFHAPADCVVNEVIHVPGDTWNVNPPALARVPRLYCRNVRAIVRARLTGTGAPMTLVAVGAILVGSVRFAFLSADLGSRATRPLRVRCSAALRRGQEMGHFQHGSTLIVLGAPGDVCSPAAGPGRVMRVGEPLMTLALRHPPTGPRPGRVPA